MLNEPTYEKLSAMKLDAMAKTWREQQDHPETAKLSFDERFGLLVDTEWVARENKRLDRCLKEAKFRLHSACIEDIDYPPKRELDKAVIRQLATCRWILEHRNVAITGATGTGKTYVACALGQQACRQGYRAYYRRASRLFDELSLARADGTYPRLLARIAKFDVLIIDDWGLAAMTDQERRDLLEVLEDRIGIRSTIVTSQLPTNLWHQHINEPTIADSICDRLLPNVHRLTLKGPSRRKLEATTSGK